MDKKITIPAGIALMVVLAVAGMLAIFSYTAATPVEAALSGGSISEAAGTTTIMVTTNKTVNDDGVITVTFPEGFEISNDLMAADVTVTSVASDADADATPSSVPIDGFSHNDDELVFNVNVDDADGIVVPTDGSTKITIAIAGSHITFPEVNEIAGDYDFGDIEVTVDEVTTKINYTVPVADDSTGLPGYKALFDPLPNKPNKSDEIELKFNAPGAEGGVLGTNPGGIAVGSFITIVLHEDFQVPDNISASDVSIDGNVMATPVSNGTRTAVADARPAKVTVDDDAVFDPGDNDSADWLIQIEVGDMAVGDAFPGVQGIDPGQPVVVNIAKAAGIKAPTEAGSYYVAYALVEEPSLTEPTLVIAELTTVILVSLSDQDGGRGDEIVATAKGISGGTADFWRDANGDGNRDVTEIYVCRSVSINDNLAECTFTVSSDFDGGHGGNCDGANKPANPSECNIVNVLDGENNRSVIDYEDAVFELKQSLSISPSEGTPGDSIVIQVQDWATDGSVDAVTVAGAGTAACGDITQLGEAELDTRMTVESGALGAVEIDGAFYAGSGDGLLPGVQCAGIVTNGDAQVTIKIPNVTPGTKQLTVYAAGDDEDTDLVVGGSSVLATPTTVIANQRISLTGTGFSAGGYINSIHLDGDRFEIPAEGVDGNRIDSGGSWTLSVNVPVTQGIADGGSQTLIVTDNKTRTGSTVLDVAVPTVSITPEEGRIDSTVTIIGENYPGLNDDGEDIEVDVDYADGKEGDDAEPDVDGRWQVSIKVPNDVAIPSTNTVRVTFQATDGPVETTFRHRVPRATIALTPTSGPEGSMVSLTGSGFNRFRPLASLRVGNIPVTVTPAPSTDRQGDLAFTFQIPGIDVGTQNVVAMVGSTTASVGFKVQDTSGVVGAVTSEVAVALEPLLMAGTLDRVFYFNNMTKQWQWHIVDPAFAASNNLNQIVSGAPLWVLVTESTTVTLNNRVVSFTCADGNCWNLITFP